MTACKSRDNNKWNSQRIQKKCKNDGLYGQWRQYSNANCFKLYANDCRQYEKHTMNTAMDKMHILDEYDLNLYQPQKWRCAVCDYDNFERDLHCSICGSMLVSKKHKPSSSTTSVYLSHFMPAEVNDAIHSNDDWDSDLQTAIMSSLEYDESHSDELAFAACTQTNITLPNMTFQTSNGYNPSAKGPNKKYVPPK